MTAGYVDQLRCAVPRHDYFRILHQSVPYVVVSDRAEMVLIRGVSKGRWLLQVDDALVGGASELEVGLAEGGYVGAFHYGLDITERIHQFGTLA